MKHAQTRELHFFAVVYVKSSVLYSLE